MDAYDGENMEILTPPVLANGERKLVLVTHDKQYLTQLMRNEKFVLSLLSSGYFQRDQESV